MEENLTKNLSRKRGKSTLKAKKSMLGGGLGPLGGDLGKKNGQEAVLGDFGQARDAQIGSKMGELGAKMEHRWRQDGLRWGLSGHLEADWGSYLEHFGGSCGRSLQTWPKCKNEHHYGVLATFSGLGGSCWRLLGLSWGVLARSWSVLGDLDLNLGPSWQHVAWPGAGGYPVRCARQAATVPNLRLEKLSCKLKQPC